MYTRARTHRSNEPANQQGRAEKATRRANNPATVIQRAQALPASALSASDLFALQRTLGNRAVQQLLAAQPAAPQASAASARPVVQAKLMVGPANDHYEQEADRIARQVTSEPAAKHGAPSVQRQTDEDEPVQRKPIASSITPLVQRQTEEDEPVQTKRVVQRQEEPGEDDQPVQTKRTAAGEAFAASGQFTSRLQASRGSGSQMPEPVRAHMESRFGADFSDVRLHTDAESAALNREVGAQAFTHGRDIYFRPGAYDPGSKQGQQLLAHELTHVVQQGGARSDPDGVRRKVNVTQAGGKTVQRIVHDPALSYLLARDNEREERNRPQPQPQPQGPGWLSRTASAIGSGIKSIGSSLWGIFRGTHWQGSSPAQRTQQVSARASQASGLSSVGGGLSSMLATDSRPLAPALGQADAAYRHDAAPSVSPTSLGFGAASGILSGTSGLISLGSGTRNVFGGERFGSGRWFRRGLGRAAAGGGQAFSGAATSARAISALTSATTGAARFLTAAAVPAQIAMGGVDFIKGGWGLWKTIKSKQMLAQKRKDIMERVFYPASTEAFHRDSALAEFAKFAHEYQGKRQKRKAINMISGALGATGGAMMMTGVGLIPGLAVAGAGGALKLGAALYGWGRDKVMNLGGRIRNWWRGTDAPLYSERKQEREAEMAQSASDQLSHPAARREVEEMLQAMGMDPRTIMALRAMTPEQRRPVILAQIMRR